MNSRTIEVWRGFYIRGGFQLAPEIHCFEVSQALVLLVDEYRTLIA